MSSRTVRIGQAAHRSLSQLARMRDASLQAVLDQAIEDFRRKCFLEAANRDFARLRKDRRAWAAELEERRAWASTLADGIDE